MRITNRRQVVQRCPAVPTEANRTDRTANCKSASSMTMIALFPPSSSKLRPKRSWTCKATCLPTVVEPVKERRSISRDEAMAVPISAPPLIREQIEVGREFCFKTRSSSFVMATAVSVVVDAGFQSIAFPQIKPTALFQP